MFFFPFLCSDIPDLALGILKMLIHLCFRDLLQPAVYKFFPGMTWLTTTLYHKCTVFTVNIFQVVAMHKKVLS